MRTRGQVGRVEERGKVRKRWYGLYYVYVRDADGKESRRHVGIGLGDKAKLSKFQAEAKLRKFIEAAGEIEKELRRLIVGQHLDAGQQAAMQDKVQSIIDSEDDPEVGAEHAKKFIASAAAIEEQLRRLIAEQGLDSGQQATLQQEVQSRISSEHDPAVGAERAIAFLNTWVQPAGDHLTLEWYTRQRFLPMKEPKWAPSTRETNLYIIDQHILPALGAVPLAKLDKFKCQIFLNDLVKPQKGAPHGFSASVIKHCRFTLAAILEEAFDVELVRKNWGRKLETPETREPEKVVLPKDQARALLEALPFRDRLMAMIASFCAMRPGEIFGLRWSSWRGDRLLIEGTAWRGVLRPGKAKTKGSKAEVVLPDILIPALKMWRVSRENPAPDELIFPSEQQTPMRPENWLRRRIKPIAAKLGISVPVNFQVLRRTFATNAEGGNMKDVMTHLRHSNIATTANVYMQPVPKSVRALVNQVAHDVMTAEPPALEEEPAAMEEPPVITRMVQ